MSVRQITQGISVVSTKGKTKMLYHAHGLPITTLGGWRGGGVSVLRASWEEI